MLYCSLFVLCGWFARLFLPLKGHLAKPVYHSTDADSSINSLTQLSQSR
jgi:hypothetical protein